MCVRWAEKKWKRVNEPMIAFKVVAVDSNGDFRSPMHPSLRMLQYDIAGMVRRGKNRTPISSYGSIVKYLLDEKVTSPKPGMYCYQTLSEAERYAGVYEYYAILEVEIPKGALVRSGSGLSATNEVYICATAVIPKKVIKDFRMGVM